MRCLYGKAMRRTRANLFAIAACMLILVPFSAMADGLTGGIRKDKVTVYDTGNLPFQKIAQDQKQAWVLAELTPVANKTGMVGVLDPKTHNVTIVSVASVFPIVQGHFDVQANLNPAAHQDSELYRFPIPVIVNGDNVAVLHEIYSPFTEGGLAICRIDETAQGRVRYKEIHVIPKEWDAFVVPAFAYYKSHASLFNRETPAKQSYPQLVALLHDPNPMLSVAACQALAHGQRLDINAVQAASAQTDPMRQAVLLFVVLTNLSDEANKPAGLLLASRIQGFVNYAKTPEDLHGIALGVSTANDVVNTELVKTVINTLASASPSSSPIGRDPYVSCLLQSTTIDAVRDKMNAEQTTPAP